MTTMFVATEMRIQDESRCVSIGKSKRQLLHYNSNETAVLLSSVGSLDHLLDPSVSSWSP
jgi:hypothetical protein